MNKFTVWIFFVILSVITNSTMGQIELINKKAKFCIMERTHKMVGFNCASLDLREVPPYLKSSTEVLDLSHNKIKELTRESFTRLLDLKYLYLPDNMIVRIEDDAFRGLVELEALDLSKNGLIEIPPEIFGLPLLRNLYIPDNMFGDRGFETLRERITLPIKAPLKILNIANNRLDKIPDLGVLPELLNLNLSSNYMRDLKPQHFSPLCNLKEVDLNNTSMERCRCEEVTRFLVRKRSADLTPHFYCDAISSECRIDQNVSFAETKDFEICMSIRRTVIAHQKAQLTWGIIGGSVVAFFLFFIGCLYCLHRRNVRQMSRKAKINNQNVKTINVAKQIDAANAADDNSVAGASPEKLLIRKTDV